MYEGAGPSSVSQPYTRAVHLVYLGKQGVRLTACKPFSHLVLHLFVVRVPVGRRVRCLRGGEGLVDLGGEIVVEEVVELAQQLERAHRVLAKGAGHAVRAGGDAERLTGFVHAS